MIFKPKYQAMIAAIILIGLSGCNTPFPRLTASVTPPPTGAPPTEHIQSMPWVEIRGSELMVDGKPYAFIGANTTNFGFYRQYRLDIDQAIRQAKEQGISVIRIYLGLGTGPWGGRSYEEYDLVLDIASDNQMYVIAVITDCCCVGTDWGPTLEKYFEAAPYCNFTDPSSLASFKSYIREILLRTNTTNGKVYREDTTILAWDLMNEPLLDRFSEEEIRGYLTEAVSYLKTIDPDHLVTLGVDASNPRYDRDGSHYDVLNIPGIDFFSFHYNLPNYHSVPQRLDRLRARVEKFASMGKPVVLEEFGVGSQRSLGENPAESVTQAWVDSYRLQMDAAFSAGASGVMFWGWGVPETRDVPLWWSDEDHDITETEFCQLIREYKVQPLP